MLVLFEQRDGGADLAGGAVAALEAVVLEEGGLDGVEGVAVGEAFDGGDLGALAATARVRQELTRRPSTRTVQAPHWPWSQPFLVPVSSRYSRRASRSVVRVSRVRVCGLPLILRVTVAVWGVVASAAWPSWAAARCGMPVATPAVRMPAALTKVRRESSMSVREVELSGRVSSELSRFSSMSVQRRELMAGPHVLMVRYQ